MTNRDDAFFDVPQTVVSTGQGDVKLPICYYDASNYMAIFPVKADRARPKLAGSGLKVLPVGGKALVALTFFKYRATSIGPYHEVGLAVLAVPENDDTELPSIAALVETLPQTGLPLHVLDLPVSTPLAEAAGREIWGYPKFVSQLPIELDGDRFDGRVFDPDGELILQLAGQRGHLLPDQQTGANIITYTLRDGQLLRTTIRTRCRYQTSGGGAIQLAIGDSQHRMANNLRDLGLANRTPKILQTTDGFQSLLFPGEPV